MSELQRNLWACGPDPSDIWNFAHRTSNVSRKPDLEDLPESIVITLNDFILDALSLGNEDLEGYRLNAIRSLRTSFWISLGTSDEERVKKFNYLLEQKTFYCGQIRDLYRRSTRGCPYYRLNQGKLVPSKKYKATQVGFGREDKASMTKSEWKRKALHSSGI